MGSEIDGDCRNVFSNAITATKSENTSSQKGKKEREISPEKVSWAKKGEREGEESAANLRAITASRKRNRAKKNGGLKERERNGG